MGNLIEHGIIIHVCVMASGIWPQGQFRSSRIAPFGRGALRGDEEVATQNAGKFFVLPSKTSTTPEVLSDAESQIEKNCRNLLRRHTSDSGDEEWQQMKMRSAAEMTHNDEEDQKQEPQDKQARNDLRRHVGQGAADGGPGRGQGRQACLRVNA